MSLGGGRADYLALGDWNAVCYFCGRKRKASTMRKYWMNFWVCPEHWEPRQPQDFVRSINDVQTPPWVQPRPDAVFLPVCYPNNTTAYPAYATPGCVMPNYINPLFNPDINEY